MNPNSDKHFSLGLYTKVLKGKLVYCLFHTKAMCMYYRKIKKKLLSRTKQQIYITMHRQSVITCYVFLHFKFFCKFFFPRMAVLSSHHNRKVCNIIGRSEYLV